MAYFLFGLGLSSYWITRCGSAFRKKTVNFNLKDNEHRETVGFKKRRKTHFYPNIRAYRYKLVHKKSLKQKDYSGGPGKIMNIPVVHCSGLQQPFTKTDRYRVF